MAQYETLSQLDGWYKETYADSERDLVPYEDKLLREIAFQVISERPGNKWHKPVITSYPHGVTFAPARSGAFALKTSIAMEMKDAQVEGANILLREQVPYESINRALNSKGAFGQVMTPILKMVTKAVSKETEVSHLYGQSGVATLASSANTNATTTVLTITESQFASGFWSGQKNALLSAYTGTTRVNIADTEAEAFTVTAFNADTRAVTVTGSAAGIAALDTAALTPGAVTLWRYGAVTGTGGGIAYTESAGINKIITNTGTLFNIDAGTVDLFKGNSTDAAGPLTFGKVLNGANKLVSRGLTDQRLVLYCNPLTWGNLLNDQASARRYDGSYSTDKVKNGSRVIEFYSQNGVIEVHSHMYVKQGEAFMFPPDMAKRIGSLDITFQDPAEGGRVFFNLENVAAKEVRCMTEQAIFFEAPATALKFTGIVNTTP